MIERWCGFIATSDPEHTAPWPATPLIFSLSSPPLPPLPARMASRITIVADRLRRGVLLGKQQQPRGRFRVALLT